MVPSAFRIVSAIAATALIAACGGASASQSGFVAPRAAQSLDIGTTLYVGKTSAPNAGGFTLTRLINMAKDDDIYTLNYIANATPIGDPEGHAIDAYNWLNFAYPALLTSGTSASARFVSAASGASGSAILRRFSNYGPTPFDAPRPRRSDTHSGRRGSPS